MWRPAAQLCRAQGPPTGPGNRRTQGPEHPGTQTHCVTQRSPGQHAGFKGPHKSIEINPTEFRIVRSGGGGTVGAKSDSCHRSYVGPMGPHKGLGAQGPRDPGARGPRHIVSQAGVLDDPRGTNDPQAPKSQSDLDGRSGGGGLVGETVAPVRAAMWDPRSPKGLGTHGPTNLGTQTYCVTDWCPGQPARNKGPTNPKKSKVFHIVRSGGGCLGGVKVAPVSAAM